MFFLKSKKVKFKNNNLKILSGYNYRYRSIGKESEKTIKTLQEQQVQQETVRESTVKQKVLEAVKKTVNIATVTRAMRRAPGDSTEWNDW